MWLDKEQDLTTTSLSPTISEMMRPSQVAIFFKATLRLKIICSVILNQHSARETLSPGILHLSHQSVQWDPYFLALKLREATDRHMTCLHQWIHFGQKLKNFSLCTFFFLWQAGMTAAIQPDPSQTPTPTPASPQRSHSKSKMCHWLHDTEVWHLPPQHNHLSRHTEDTANIY